MVAGGTDMNMASLGLGFVVGSLLVVFLMRRRNRSQKRAVELPPENLPPESPTRTFLRLQPGESPPDQKSGLPGQRGQALRDLEASLDEAMQDALGLLKECFPDSLSAGIFFPGRGEGWYLRIWLSGAESIIPGAVLASQQGLMGRLMKEETLRIFEGDIPGDSTQLHYYAKDEGVRSLAAVPILAGGSRRGAVFIDSRKTNAFDQKKTLEKLEGLSRCAGLLAYHAYLAFEYNQHRERLQHFSSYQRKFLENMSESDIVGVVLEYMIESIEANRYLVISRVEPGSDRAVVVAAEGLDAPRLRGFQFNLGDGGLLRLAFEKEQVVNRVFRSGDPVFRMSHSEPYSGSLQNLLAVPVPTDRGVGMVLCVESTKAVRFAEPLQNLLLTMARAAGFALSRAHLYREKEDLASRDGLTGVLNHRSFQEKLREELLRSERTGRRVAVLMLDIDFFKRINDTYGHPVGDSVLQETARILAESVRPNEDIVARYGGEEFACLLPNADRRLTSEIAERIRQAVEAKEYDMGQTRFHSTLSIGAAIFPDDAHHGKELLEKADKALYKAKESGRNRIILYH